MQINKLRAMIEDSIRACMEEQSEYGSLSATDGEDEVEYDVAVGGIISIAFDQFDVKLRLCVQVQEIIEDGETVYLNEETPGAIEPNFELGE